MHLLSTAENDYRLGFLANLSKLTMPELPRSDRFYDAWREEEERIEQLQSFRRRCPGRWDQGSQIGCFLLFNINIASQLLLDWSDLRLVLGSVIHWIWGHWVYPHPRAREGVWDWPRAKDSTCAAPETAQLYFTSHPWRQYFFSVYGNPPWKVHEEAGYRFCWGLRGKVDIFSVSAILSVSCAVVCKFQGRPFQLDWSRSLFV